MMKSKMPRISPEISCLFVLHHFNPEIMLHLPQDFMNTIQLNTIVFPSESTLIASDIVSHSPCSEELKQLLVCSIALCSLAQELNPWISRTTELVNKVPRYLCANPPPKT